MAPAKKIILSIDTSDKTEAQRLAGLAASAGAEYIKLGLELSTATSWQWCAELAQEHNLDWVADAKLDDIPNTVKASIDNFRRLPQPPFGITVHAAIGIEAMRTAQTAAAGIKLLAVTVLTSINEAEAQRQYGKPVKVKVMEFAEDAADAGLAGIVASPQEVSSIKNNPKTQNLFTMIPGTRSEGASKDDQARTATPTQAIRDGADLLVIGRQVTLAADPAAAYKVLLKEIEEAMNG